MDVRATLDRFEALESNLLNLVQEVRALKADIRKAGSNQLSLESLLDAEQLAKILRVEVPYVYSQARARKIPSVKVGKYRRFSPAEVKRWLERKTTV